MNREAVRQIDSIGQFEALATSRVKRSYRGEVLAATLRVVNDGVDVQQASEGLSEVMWSKFKTNISLNCAEKMINNCKYTITVS